MRVTRGVNWQPSKGLNIYRQPRFREIFNRQMTKWQSSVKREIYSGKKKKKKVGSDFEWRVYGVSNAKMLEVIRVLGTFRYLRRILLTKPLFYWYWQKGLNFSDNWQSHNPLVTLYYSIVQTSFQVFISVSISSIVQTSFELCLHDFCKLSATEAWGWEGRSLPVHI